MYQLADPARVFTELMNILIRLASVGLIHGDFNEFNVMLSDDYQVSVIDFPQMISTSHFNADTLFNRDKDCVLTFFSRRYDFQPDDSLPSLKDIEKMNSLDEDVKASGFTADVEDDCNEFLIANQRSDSESDEDQSHDEESEKEIDENAENNHVEPSNSDAQQEFLDCRSSHTEVSNVSKAVDTETSNRISDKSSTRNTVKTSELSAIPQTNEQQELEAELEQNYERMYPTSTEKARDLNEEVGRDLMSRLRLDSDVGSVGQQSNRSKASTAYVSTTIPPSVIKQRLQRQSAKQAKRDQCRKAVKHGEASLKTKKRQETSDDIKTSISAVWY